jgi:hypothetical protein
MPTIKLDAPASKDQIRDVLRRRCPDLDLMNLGPMITASESRWIAAAINPQRNNVYVMPMVRSMPMFLLFFLMALSGIGIVIYAVTAAPRQKQVAERVTAVLERELRTLVRNDAQLDAVHGQ